MEKMKQGGFTLVEIAITMGIMIAVSVSGYVAFSGLKPVKNLENTTNEVSAVIRATQKKAVTQESGRAWGIRFFGSTSTTPSYEVATGTSYSAGAVSRTYYLGRNVIFGNPGGSSTLDMFFSAINGKLSQNQIISLNTGRPDGFVNDIIANKQGSVTVRERTGVVGYWHLDEATATTTYDASGFGNNGTLGNGSSWQSASNCKSGACLGFDGSDDQVDVGTSVGNFSKNEPFTVGTWFYISSLPSANKGIASRMNASSIGWHIRITSGNAARFIIASDGSNYRGSDTTTLTTGWNYLVGVYDGSSASTYLNGVLSSTPITGGTLGTITGSINLYIGRDPNTSSFLNGRVDEVKLYNKALTAQEILDEYNDLKQ
ncbi:MAG: LamG-like jellyroll fold domain-containing protein [Patescibacteria group bacterium]